MVVATVLLNLHHIDVALAATQMILAKLVIHALSDVVDAPVHAIQKEVNIEGINASAAYFSLHPSCPDITGVLRPFAVATIPMLPGIAEMTTQHELVELLGFIGTEQRIIQRLRTIL